MSFAAHCDTSLALFEAMVARRPFTAVRLSTGEVLNHPVRMFH